MSAKTVTADELPPELLRMLGLPRHTISATIHLKARELIRVECEFHPEVDTDGLADWSRVEKRGFMLLPVECEGCGTGLEPATTGSTGLGSTS